LKVSVLTKDEIKKIHEGSLDILSTVGVLVPHDETLKRFREAGADVCMETQRVKISADLVQKCLDSAGREYVLYGRDRKKQARFGKGDRNYNASGGQALWLDDDTLDRRYAVLDDVDIAVTLCDALDGINIAGAMVVPHDVSSDVQDALVLSRVLKNTTKPFTFWFNTRESARYISEMLIAVAGSEEEAAKYPMTYNFLEPISPLRFDFNGIDLLYETARFPLPVSIGPMAQAGATAPVTLAGALVQENAEILAGICITQLIHPGTPVCYGGIPHIIDLRTTQMVFSGPEQALMAVAMTEIGKFYSLPVYINVGLTDSKLPDAQAGIECGITLATGVAAGADIFGHFGICGVDQAASLAMLVMQNELIGYVERLARGLAVNDKTLALDVIKNVGPGGNYLAEMHTAEHFRQEHWFPNLFDRKFFDAWAEGGKKNMSARCKEVKDELLRTYEPEPLPEDVTREIDKITESALKSD